jgi:hypothetical protein
MTKKHGMRIARATGVKNYFAQTLTNQLSMDEEKFELVRKLRDSTGPITSCLNRDWLNFGKTFLCLPSEVPKTGPQDFVENDLKPV